MNCISIVQHLQWLVGRTLRKICLNAHLRGWLYLKKKQNQSIHLQKSLIIARHASAVKMIPHHFIILWTILWFNNLTIVIFHKKWKMAKSLCPTEQPTDTLLRYFFLTKGILATCDSIRTLLMHFTFLSWKMSEMLCVIFFFLLKSLIVRACSCLDTIYECWAMCLLWVTHIC